MRLTFAMFCVLFLAGAQDAQDSAKKEMALLEGDWSMLSGEINGEALPEELRTEMRRVAKYGETTVTMSGRVYLKAKFTIDPTKKPKAIDYTFTEGPTKGKTQFGIYEIDGDKVKFCFSAPGKDRPTEFTAKEGSERTLSVWKRKTKS
ncbi:MAG: TIGR03067 domain-containing protein [Planctomycetes bacterium]|nr:TIGR03067 domain-containing protein [Planctomycetota bacterium]